MRKEFRNRSLQRGMKRLRRDFGEWRKNEFALMHRRMRKSESRHIEHGAIVQEKIKVDGSRAFWH